MFLLNRHPEHGRPLDAAEAALLGPAGAAEIARYLAFRAPDAATPLLSLPALAAQLGIGALHVKDEGPRLGLGSFKALGGAYAVMRLVLEKAGRTEIGDLARADVREVAGGMTFACATDGNHGRSVAQGAQLIGARAVIFVHGGVSEERVAAIARFGAEVVRVAGNYDDSVREAARVAEREGWAIVSDTSWPGYERIPGLVMQGYTAIADEALRELEAPPTHVFVQAGVGGIAAAMAGYFAAALGERRPVFTVVEPACAACLYASAEAGTWTQIAQGEPTVMAMLECYEPSMSAWRVLARAADAFMAVEEDEAVAAMNRLAWPSAGDPAVVAGESGCVGFAGLAAAAGDPARRAALRLDAGARVLVVNTEGATDPGKYEALVGMRPEAVVHAAR